MFGRIVCLAAAAIVGGLCGTAAWADAPFLIKDITTFPVDETPYFSFAWPVEMASLNGLLLFSGWDAYNGTELWCSDGTEAGTHLFRDLYPGRQGSSPQSLMVFNGILYFSAHTCYGRVLWKSDGTPEGTDVVLNVYMEMLQANSVNWADMGSYFFFRGFTFGEGEELWRSDGTPGGTRLVKDLSPGFTQRYPNSSTPQNYLRLGDRLLFCAGPGYAGLPHVSDGTSGGTVPLTTSDLCSTAFVRMGDQAFYASQVTGGYKLYRTNGTPSGTVPLGQFALNDWMKPIAAVEDRLICARQLEGQSYPEAWSMDASGGDRQLLSPWRLSVHPIRSPHVFGGALYFDLFAGGRQRALFRTDGTAAGTVLVADYGSVDLAGAMSPPALTVGEVFFFLAPSAQFSNYAVWRSDGTTAGTFPLFAAMPLAMTEHNGECACITYDGRLVLSDGTVEGTREVARLLEKVSESAAEAVYPLGDRLVYVLKTPVTWDHGAEGREYWGTDGTNAGTEKLVGFVEGTKYDWSYGFNKMLPLSHDGRLFFTVSAINLEESQPQKKWLLWTTDGTAAGTRSVTEMSWFSSYDKFPFANLTQDERGILVATSRLVEGVLVKGVWRTADGVPENMELVLEAGFRAPSIGGILAHEGKLYVIEVGDRLYQTPPRPNLSRCHLYVYDPQTGQKTLLMDTPAGQYTGLQAVGGKVWFKVECSGADFRTRLGVTDGTPGGTRLVTSHQPPEMPWDTLSTREDTLTKYWGPTGLTALGNLVLFQDATAAEGYELWKTDGTTASMVVNIGEGGSYGVSEDIVGAPDTVYFEGMHKDTGRELWRSDGTEAGTRLVKDIYPGLAGSAIQSSVDVDGTVFFGAGDPEHGMELWMSAGTEDTTGRLTDINPGVASSGPAAIERLGDNLVFFASDGTDEGTGLWGMQLPLMPPAGADGVGVSTSSIRWLWGDPNSRELGFRIWSDPGTERPVTLRHETAADVTAWLQTGLSANTQHTFQVAAFEEGAESLRSAPISAWTLIEPLRGLAFSAVAPDRITVAAASPVPSNLSAGHSGLRFFNLGSGTSSAWIQGNAGWTVEGLTADTPYVFSGRSRNGDMVMTAPVIGMARTLAWTAAAPVVGDPTGTTLRVALGPAVGNPVHTTYGIRVILPGGGLGWVTANGTVGTSPVFLTAEAWGVTTVTGLADGSPYGFRVVSRNGDGIWSPPGPVATAWTLDVTPPTAEILLPDRNPNNEASVRFTVRFSESVGDSFDASDVTLTGTLAGAASVGGEDLEYTVTVALSDLSASGEVGIRLGTDIRDLADKPFAGMESARYTLLRWAGFASHPDSVRLYRGQDHLLSVTVNAGYAPTAYQWFKETPDKGVETGPVGPQWPLENVTSGHAGVYWCEVTDGGVVYASRPALVEVAEHLAITEEPADTVGYTGRSALFRVGTSGGFAPVRCQWRKDGAVLDGAESPECWLHDVTFEDAGLYSAEVSDGHTELLETRHAELTVAQGVPAASAGMAALLAALLAGAGTLLRVRRRKT